MVKLRGFGGETEFWDHALVGFTLMAGIAVATEWTKPYASTAVLTLPPTIVAGMVSTIDSIASVCFDINIKSGWTEAECTQSGLWPGKEHYECHYEYSAGYVTVEGSVDNQSIESQGPLFLDGGLQAESSPRSDAVDRLGQAE